MNNLKEYVLYSMVADCNTGAVRCVTSIYKDASLEGAKRRVERDAKMHNCVLLYTMSETQVKKRVQEFEIRKRRGI